MEASELDNQVIQQIQERSAEVYRFKHAVDHAWGIFMEAVRLKDPYKVAMAVAALGVRVHCFEESFKSMEELFFPEGNPEKVENVCDII